MTIRKIIVNFIWFIIAYVSDNCVLLVVFVEEKAWEKLISFEVKLLLSRNCVVDSSIDEKLKSSDVLAVELVDNCEFIDIPTTLVWLEVPVPDIWLLENLSILALDTLPVSRKIKIDKWHDFI